VIGGLFIAAGVGLFWTLPWHGAGAAAIGAGVYTTAGKQRRKEVEETFNAISLLSKRLELAVAET
jgi:uncharacterized membrane protein